MLVLQMGRRHYVFGLSARACVLAAADAFSDRLVVDFYTVSQKTSTFYFSNNSCQKLNNFKDFWHVKSWENWHENIADLSTSVDRTQCSLLVFLQYFTAKYHLNFLALLRHVGLSVAAPTRLLTVVLQINMLLIGAPNVRTHPTRILLLLVAPTALSTFRTSCDLEFWFLTLTVKLDIPYVPKTPTFLFF